MSRHTGRNEYKPYDRIDLDLRHEWAKRTIELAYQSMDAVDIDDENKAHRILRYAATLKVRDEQIEALIVACEKFSRAHNYAYEAMVNPQDLAEFATAIVKAKEACYE